MLDEPVSKKTGYHVLQRKRSVSAVCVDLDLGLLFLQLDYKAYICQNHLESS